MGRKRLKEEDVGIDLTPLIDIILQLIVFFVLTTAFVPFLVNVELPKALSSPSNEERVVVITLTKGGDIYWDKEVVSLSELPKRVETTGIEVKYLIRGDKGAEYGKVVALISELKKMGVRRLGLVVEPEH